MTERIRDFLRNRRDDRPAWSSIIDVVREKLSDLRPRAADSRSSTP